MHDKNVLLRMRFHMSIVYMIYTEQTLSEKMFCKGLQLYFEISLIVYLQNFLNKIFFNMEQST